MAPRSTMRLLPLLFYSVFISRTTRHVLSMSMNTPVYHRTFFVTGATDGIGKHTCERLASDGSAHALLIHGRKSSQDPVVKSLIRDLESRGAARVSYLQADLNDLNQVEKLADDAKGVLSDWQQDLQDSFPALDVLINNAGVFDPEPRHSAQGYDSTMAINVLAPFVLTRKLLPCLVRGENARIITTSSISQSSALPNMDQLFAQLIDSKYDHQPLSYSAHSFYSHSKLGDLLFTVNLAKVLSKYSLHSNIQQLSLLDNMHNIQCLTMDPGTVNTKMLLAGWGACGIPVEKANNTYKLATSEEYANGRVESGSYHFGFRRSSEANGDAKLNEFWNKLSVCTGSSYDDLSDCF